MASIAERKQPLRVLALLDGLARVSVFNVPLRAVHELAYLANVLAPVFELPAVSASLLKRRGGPYYPELQQTVDRLVGLGMVTVSGLRYIYIAEEERYRMDAGYALDEVRTNDLLRHYRDIYWETGEPHFIEQLTAAYAVLNEDLSDGVVLQDARYADDDVDTNDVIDFGEWSVLEASNFSFNAAMAFRPGEPLRPAERLFMYMEHMQRRVTHAR